MGSEKNEALEKGIVKSIKTVFRRVVKASWRLKSAVFLFVLGVGLIVGSFVGAIKSGREQFRLFEEIAAKPEHQELLQNVKDNIDLAQKELGIQEGTLSYKSIVELKLLEKGHEDGIMLDKCKSARETKFLCHMIPGLAALMSSPLMACSYVSRERKKEQDLEDSLE